MCLSVVESCSTAQGLGAHLFSLVKVRKTTTKKQKIPITETYETIKIGYTQL
jgi:hypothetical protein